MRHYRLPNKQLSLYFYMYIKLSYQLQIKIIDQQNQQKTLEMSNLETPTKKNDDQQIPETGIKEEQEVEDAAQNEVEEDSVSKAKDILDRIEADINGITERMNQIEGEKRKFKEDSEDFQNLDDEVRVLKKEAIDLQYQHRLAFNNFKKLEKEAQQREAKDKEPEVQDDSKVHDAPKQRYNLDGKYFDSTEQHKNRIRELQFELAVSSRKRRIQAEVDLIALRSLQPYYLPRYYPYYSLYRQPLIYSRYLDPLYYDPIYYPYRYPLYSDLIYPYIPLRYI